MISTPPVKSSATQHGFGLKVSMEMPLVPIEVAVFYLEQAADDVLNLIEIGHLECAFNVGSKEARRREVRIFWRALESYRMGTGEEIAKTAMQRSVAQDAAALAAVIDQILPPLRGKYAAIETVRCADLAIRLACDSTHVIHLISEGELQFFSKDRYRSPLITRASAVEFLKRRRIS